MFEFNACQNCANGGGAIAVEHTRLFIVSDSILRHNDAPDCEGGAIWARYSQVIIKRSELRENRAGYIGGAIKLYESTTTLTDNAMLNNYAGHFTSDCPDCGSDWCSEEFLCRGGAIAEEGQTNNVLDALTAPTLVMRGNKFAGNKGVNGHDTYFTYTSPTKLTCPGSSCHSGSYGDCTVLREGKLSEAGCASCSIGDW